ncbi:MAG TPA: biopolymer transporter ExbD [Steroidobacteraceae bacterium]
MSLRHRHARLLRKPAELMLVPMIDIFTVLVTFLLMTAVFSRIAIVELDLPSTADGPAVTEPQFRLEVIVRKEGFELTNGSSVIAAIPKQDGAYDLRTLSELALSLKQDHPDVDQASVLLEPEIAYDDLIQVMDAVRSTETTADGGVKPTRVVLFSNIAVGDAPIHGGTSS